MRRILALRPVLRQAPTWSSVHQRRGLRMRPAWGGNRPAAEPEYEEEEEEDEEQYRIAREYKDELAAYVKTALDPAWSFSRKRVYTPEPEALERIEGLSRLITARQARKLAARVLGSSAGKLRTKPAAEEDDEEDEDEEGEEEEAGRRKAAKRGLVEDEEEEEEGMDEDERLDRWEEELKRMRGGGRKAAGKGTAEQQRAPEEGTIEAMLGRRRKALDYTPGEALTYLTRTVMANYSITTRVLSEAFSAPGSGGVAPPRSVLDFGCGPGTGLLAAHALWPELQRIEGVERSESMLDLTRLMLQHVDDRRLLLHRHLPALAEQVSRTGELYDVVLSSYTLTELESEAAMAAAAQLLWAMVAPQGVLVLVEAGNPLGSHVVRSVRKMVLDNRRQPAGGGEAYTVGPCPHDHPCPLQGNEWCSFQQRVQAPSLLSSRGRGGGKNFRDVAFSYVILRKAAAPVPAPEAWSRYSALHELLRRSGPSQEQQQQQLGLRGRQQGGDAEEEDGSQFDWDSLDEQPLLRGEWSRIVRSPKKSKGRVSMELCTPDGHVEQVTVARAAARALPGKMLAARKAEWGGLWPYPEI